ncbi:type II toxin-antitoxin system prevent-host-death family antitoxin [Acidimicrobium ferrooxidans]|uniref:Type II toxin-antitoxin system prevent-host-death family antitoxin n=1 Tax=Acidimicrobium ferrooxidans TaxID=53635 RepID=A0ABS3ANT5_9ACTN|nr:type II toxin-antitoxin system prevent-host-death family antitoxin [Acidimicrobium ferrooxidans]
MTDVASRELRNNTRSLLDRVSAGEHITITVDGRAVAELKPPADRPVWMASSRFSQFVLRHQADSALTADLASLSNETTDDLPL